MALWPQYVPETHGEEDQGDVDNAALFPRGTEILIPYATVNSTERAILTINSKVGGADWSFSTLCTIEREREKFQLDGSMFVDREALILGNDMATLIMRPHDMNGDHLTYFQVDVRLTVEPLTVKYSDRWKFLMSNSQTIARPHALVRLSVHKIYA